MLSIGVFKENIKVLSLGGLLIGCLLFGPPTFAKSSLSPEKVSRLEKSIQKKPDRWKPRYKLASHFATQKDWLATKNTLAPVVENLPKKGLLLLLRAQRELGDYLAMEPVVASLRNQPKLSLKSKIEVLTASTMVLRKTLRTSYAVGEASAIDAAASEDKPTDNNDDKKKEDNEKKSEDPSTKYEEGLNKSDDPFRRVGGSDPNSPDGDAEEEATAVAYASSPKIDEVALFFKEALKAHPASLKLNDLYLGFLEEFIDHYAYEGIVVLDALAEKRRLRKRHLSKLCQYTTMAAFTKRAIESCQMAVKKDPDNFQNSVWLGKAHMASGNDKKGSRMLASIGKNHSNSAEALQVSAEHFLESKNYPKAYKYFSQATRNKDVSPAVYLGLANTAMELKKFDVALKAFQAHCQQTKNLHQDFRRASGVLASEPEIQRQFRKIMRVCNK